MSGTQDVMDRLAAADPLAEPRPLTQAEQREADALLERLLAAPAAEPPPARARRRWAQLAGATAVAAVAAFALLSLLDSEDGRAPSVVARAVAALTQPDAVYHAAFITHLSESSMATPPGRTPYQETWHTTGGRTHSRAYVARNGGKGRFVSEWAGQRRPGRLGGPALMWDARTNTITQIGFGRVRNPKGAPTVDPFDPGRSLKELEAEGRLRVAGEVNVDGRRAYRLVSGNTPSPGDTIQSSVIVVDADTYFPITQRFSIRAANGETVRVRWDYLIYERLPLNRRTSALLDFDPPPGAKCAPHTDRLVRKGSLGFPNPCAK